MAQAGKIRIAIGQMDCEVGDLPANVETVERLAQRAIEERADLLVLPELALSGYAVGQNFANTSLSPGSQTIERFKELSKDLALAIGFIEETQGIEFYNSAMFLHSGSIAHVHRKVYLPNYRIFDERRYFGPGRSMWAFDTPWCRMAMLICGDAWHLSLPYLAAHDGADVLLVLAASSTEGLTPAISVRDAWEQMNRSYALTLSNFVVFANRVGRERMSDCEETLDFWGGSHVCTPDGRIAHQAAIGEEDLLITDLDLTALRAQRLILPFRRDDDLDLTLDIGKHILRSKTTRREGFLGLIERKRRARDNC